VCVCVCTGVIFIMSCVHTNTLSSFGADISARRLYSAASVANSTCLYARWRRKDDFSEDNNSISKRRARKASLGYVTTLTAA